MPKSPLILTRYDELDQLVCAFANDRLNLLVIVGRAGVQKTTVVRAAVRPGACWIDGNVTAFGMYCELFEHQNDLVVIDDVNSLYADRASVRLLKSLCQTEPLKHVAWHSYAAPLTQRGIPRQFHTTSRVAILANDWKTLNANVAAIEDRGHLVRFEPTPLEVHVRTATWFWDQEIFDFVGQHLHLAGRLSMRDYRLSWELKEAGLPWRKYLPKRWGVCDKLHLVAELKADRSFAAEEERVQAFVRQGGGSRGTYFNLARKLRAIEDVPPCALTGQPPQMSSPIDESVMDLLKRRHRGIGEG